ncbi:MAG: ribosome small subunit-dependent GTPase A [Candidatus Eremiobacteraeota bacterium]|nr:ribosome small subunit-dependent GTPase A [Candidatus Eremiobacteraeota bacterium]
MSGGHTGRPSPPAERVDDDRALARVGDAENHPGETFQDDISLPRDGRDLIRTPKIGPALVISVGRNSAWAVFDDETQPRMASLRRRDEKNKRNKKAMKAMLVPGDVVDARLLEDGSVVVERVHARNFALERRTVGGRMKTMAANVDTIAIVAALVAPPIRLSMVDQLVAFAELQDRRAVLFLTKADLTDAGAAAGTVGLYAQLGYTALVVQPKTGDGMDALRARLSGSRALLVGQSGVGKSAIFRALGGTNPSGEVSRFGRGRQTTTAARLVRLDGGFLIDSPGIGAFELGDVDPQTIAPAFVEFAALAQRCRFRDCAHLAEPGCAIREAVASGEVAASRYESYRLILSRGDPLSAYA